MKKKHEKYKVRMDMIRWCPLSCFSRDIVEQLINYYSA